jgi:hypothetical protein
MKGELMSSSDVIRDAIERSRANGSQKQAVSVGLTCAALEILLMAMLPPEWWMVEAGVNRVEVWGWSDATPEGEQDWRLVIEVQS